MVDDPVLRMALAAHTQTIKALMDYIEGHETALPGFIHKESGCAIERWLDGDGARYADLPSYGRARAVHMHFHHAVAEIVELLHSGNKDAAMAKLRSGSVFARLSRQMLAAFEDLSEAIQGVPHQS